MISENAYTNSSEKLNHDIEAMYQSFVASNDLRDSTQQILKLAMHLTGAENCSLMLLNGHSELYVLNSSGLGGPVLYASRIKIGEGIAGQVADQGEPILVEDIDSDERFSLHKRSRYRTGSFIACPISSWEMVIGILNLNDKKSGEPFNAEDFDQAKLVSLMAAVSLRKFLGEDHFKVPEGSKDELYSRLVEVECNNREFVARLAHDIRTPLNNIKGSVFYLKGLSGHERTDAYEFYEIIEKELKFLVSYLDEGVSEYANIQVKLADIEEFEKYQKLLD